MNSRERNRELEVAGENEGAAAWPLCAASDEIDIVALCAARHVWLMVIAATFDPIEVTPIQLISGSRALQGWAAGTAADSEDTLRFAELTGVRPMIETYRLEKAARLTRA